MTHNAYNFGVFSIVLFDLHPLALPSLPLNDINELEQNKVLHVFHRYMFTFLSAENLKRADCFIYLSFISDN